MKDTKALSKFDATEEMGFDEVDQIFCSADDDEVSCAHSRVGSNYYSDAPEALGKDETKQVCVLRFIVIVALLATAAAMSAFTYVNGRRIEAEHFENDFEDKASKIVGTFHFNVERKLGAINAFSVSLTSQIRSLNQTWPFVTVDDFAIRALSIRSVTDAIAIYFLPIVREYDRTTWEDYAWANRDWIEEGLEFENEVVGAYEGNAGSRFLLQNRMEDDSNRKNASIEYDVSRSIFEIQVSEKVPDRGDGPYYPLWLSQPVVPDLINFNMMSSNEFNDGIHVLIESEQAVLGRVPDVSGDDIVAEALSSSWKAEANVFADDPVSDMLFPVFDSFNANKRLVGVLQSIIYWETFFIDSISGNPAGCVAVLENECDQKFTYKILEDTVVFLGEGDLHDPCYDEFEVFDRFENFKTVDLLRSENQVNLNQDYCHYTIRVYPTKDLFNYHATNGPIVQTTVVGSVFILTAFIFFMFNFLVEKRQKLILRSAEQTGRVVNQLFPASFRERMLRSNSDTLKCSDQKSIISDDNGFIQDDSSDIQKQNGEKAMAEMFPNTTVFFADIVGFTAWSSVREPDQVFILLEGIYNHFDKLAKRRGVFKVETIGDCYLAVTGLPVAREDHATAMARFAFDCRSRFATVTNDLEVKLGPDTADLSMRMGLHSGPVTAGILRGQKSRFQLFGDTVNTASRMESTGAKNKIQCSQITAELLMTAGKAAWITPRDTKIKVKGKGEVQTYWVEPQSASSSSQTSSSRDLFVSDSSMAPPERHITRQPSVVIRIDEKKEDPISAEVTDEKSKRLIDWHVRIFSDLLQQIVAKRRLKLREQKDISSVKTFAPTREPFAAREEVLEFIEFSKFEPSCDSYKSIEIQCELDSVVISQLQSFVTTIWMMYYDHPFHSFEHACHVTMASRKLFRGIVNNFESNTYRAGSGELKAKNACGVVNDPLTEFAVIFCALIHDADHWGISNQQVAKENPDMASRFMNKSIAEQNAVSRAWEAFMDPRFKDLQQTIFVDEREYRQFQQLVCNLVISTDICDAELRSQQNYRWEKAFPTRPNESLARRSPNEVSMENLADLKTTLVLESLLQAADISHTMQHWEIFKTWNRKLFHEMYSAYQKGRADKDPSEGWYSSELWFFDNCVIPLAERLGRSGVFGSASDECLSYALENRLEWEASGKDVVLSYLIDFEVDNREEEIVSA